MQTLVAWADGGAPEGDAKQMPALPHFEPGWNIGKPDFVVPSNFTEDKWVEAAEIRPDQRSVIHHVIVFVQDANAPPTNRRELGNLLVGFAPGEPPAVLDPGTAILVKAGSRLMFQVHYTPSATNRDFAIPPGDANYQVSSSWTTRQDVTLLGLMPHMHLRGKDFQYTVVYLDGREEVILSVPKYDFNWQLVYELKSPLALPKGARIDCVAHFDNSPNNKFNPDPAKEVKWGDQTFEEMMMGFFTYRVPVETGASKTAF